MRKTIHCVVRAAAVLAAAGWVNAAPPVGGIPDAAAAQAATKAPPGPSEIPVAVVADAASVQAAFDACLTKSVETAAHALMLDPLTAAVSCPADIHKMTFELFDAEKKFLPGFKPQVCASGKR